MANKKGWRSDTCIKELISPLFCPISKNKLGILPTISQFILNFANRKTKEHK